MCDMREKSARSRKMARRAKAITSVESGAITAAEEGAESATSRRRGRARHSRGSSYILGRCDNDQLLAEPTNGAGIAVSAADVGWDTALRRWSAERAPKGPWTMARVPERVRAGAGSRELHIAMMPAQSGRTTPKIERVRAFSRRDVHHWILGVTSPIVLSSQVWCCRNEN